MSYSISRVDWQLAAPLLRTVREKVFVCEYRIPKKVEFDRLDSNAFHLLICDDNSQEPIATGRLLNTGEISRVAVLPTFRDNNLDFAIFTGLVKIAKEQGLTEVFIYSPLQLVDYYRQHNFRAVGSVYMEAGIARQRMSCAIDNNSIASVYFSH